MDLPLRLQSLHLRPGHPDFLDLPWELPLSAWPRRGGRVVELPRGNSRHTVVFVGYGEALYALKALPEPVGQREWRMLRGLEERHLPAVTPVALVQPGAARGQAEAEAVLITRFLPSSLPYRTLFMSPGLARYRTRLLDAMASLLVRLHLGGFFWGDCSLSNVLFRRDAGELQAYAVDAETSELHPRLSDGQRSHDLDILEENVAGDLADLRAQLGRPLEADAPDAPLDELAVGRSIRERYGRLWDEVTRELVLAPRERYRIHERIRALNALGFSVGEVEVLAGGGGQLRVRTIVTDREYHRQRLHGLLGLVAEEQQARQLLNEVRELHASLRVAGGGEVPLQAAAYRWLSERYQPTLARLEARLGPLPDPAETYCQVLEHKWFLSERARRDVGLKAAVDDYLQLRTVQAAGTEAASAGALRPSPLRAALAPGRASGENGGGGAG